MVAGSYSQEDYVSRLLRGAVRTEDADFFPSFERRSNIFKIKDRNFGNQSRF